MSSGMGHTPMSDEAMQQLFGGHGEKVISVETTTGNSSPESTQKYNPDGALRQYSENFKSVDDDGPPALFNRRAFPWRNTGSCAPMEPKLNEEEVRAELEQDLNSGGQNRKTMALERRKGASYQNQRSTKDTWAEDSDKEQVGLCLQCHLPLGDISYNVDDSRCAHVHGECMAQRVLEEMKKEEKEHRLKEKIVKQSRREEFDIGWSASSVPRNMGPAEKMGCPSVPQGMCCLVLQAAPYTIQVAPTIQPAGSVNLEYLAIALKVRRQEGREPLFSLDPVDPTCADLSMQVKRFEPEWLAGTSVGDVLFQADYYLKELSMGEYEQPVIGMRSCFDYSWDEGHNADWRAREWFVVRKAEVHISDDNVLVPYVRMGVEAWEQVVGTDGQLWDSKVTRPNHPLLMYAEAFARNFELIAERKSVIFHLRELAKASVLAKCLVEGNVNVPEVWYNVANDAHAGAADNLEIPQLWNERHVGKIYVKEGTIVNSDDGIGTSTHGVYGGVAFGLEKFSVAAPGRISRSMLDVGGQGARATLTAAQAFAPRRVFGPGALVDASMRAVSRMPAPQATITSSQAFAARRAFMPGTLADPSMRAISRAPSEGMPKGVDLNLDKFDVSQPTRVSTEVPLVQMGGDACAAIGEAFWSNIDGCNESVFKAEDKSMLACLFNPCLSDRREEADQFVPPDTSRTYVERLRELLKEEDMKRAERKHHFFSKQFEVSNPGPLFPSSWKDLIEIERARAPGKVVGTPQKGTLHERADYKAKAHMFDHLLKSGAPVFDKSTEEGIRFRAYKIGSIQVRTTQEPNADEIVGVVFSTSASAQARTQSKHGQKLKEDEQIVKATTYVERDAKYPLYHRYYLTLETEVGNMVVTEMLRDGSVIWNENPADLEDRNSLAKVFRSKECQGKGVTVKDMRGYQRKGVEHKRMSPLHSTGKRYAQGAYDRARGETLDFASYQRAICQNGRLSMVDEQSEPRFLSEVV